MNPTQLNVSQSSDLYETDFYAWTVEQAKFLRDGAWHSLDIQNLAEEIESLGKQDRRELRNRLRVLIGHLLKWEYQPGKRSRSWSHTIYEQRYQIKELIKESLSLKSYLRDAVMETYSDALDLALRETSLDESCFPKDCCYSLEQILETVFFPG
ncbi:MAG: DUF29 domain-containing protein [Desertifilum sp. SIO1I2]|nr:DUF29 domain-containing protein [Desertifilum sp. SIO1I2]